MNQPDIVTSTKIPRNWLLAIGENVVVLDVNNGNVVSSSREHLSRFLFFLFSLDWSGEEVPVQAFDRWMKENHNADNPAIAA